jgi:hypothetical protein
MRMRCPGNQPTSISRIRVNSVAGRGQDLVPPPRPVACVVDVEKARTLATTRRGECTATTHQPVSGCMDFVVCGAAFFITCRCIIAP